MNLVPNDEYRRLKFILMLTQMEFDIQKIIEEEYTLRKKRWPGAKKWSPLGHDRIRRSH